MLTLIIFLTLGILLSTIGLLFTRGKCLNLIAGYNTLSVAEKRKIDKKRMGKNVGFYCIGIGLITTIVGFLLFFLKDFVQGTIIIYTVVVSISTVLLIIIENRGINK